LRTGAAGTRRRPGRAAAALTAVLIAWMVGAGEACADRIVLKSGEAIEGRVIDATRNTVIVLRSIGGMRQMPIGDIEEVRVDLPRGQQMVGQLLGWADGVYEVRSGDEIVRVGESGVVSREPGQQTAQVLPTRPRGAQQSTAAAAPAAGRDGAAAADEAEPQEDAAEAQAAAPRESQPGATAARAAATRESLTAAARQSEASETESQAAAEVADQAAAERPSRPVANAQAPAEAEPETRAADAQTPAEAEPDTRAADAQAPAEAEPETRAADAQVPAEAEPETRAADARTAATTEPETRAADAQAPAEAEPETRAADARTAAAAEPETRAAGEQHAALGDQGLLAVKASVDPPAPGARDMVFNIELSQPAKQTIVLIYGTVDGTAKAGEDYEAQQGMVTLAPGASAAEVRVPLLEGAPEDGEKRFELVLMADPKVAEVVDRRVIATIKGAD
jgi:Calx-beta domain